MSYQKKTAHDKILARVARVEGQVRGIRKMIERGDECRSVMVQISAAREAIAMLGVTLVQEDITFRLSEKENMDEMYLRNLFRMY